MGSFRSALVCVALLACALSQRVVAQDSAGAPAAAQAEPVYVCPPCPSDCHSLTFSKPGSCPTCGMLLILKPAGDKAPRSTSELERRAEELYAARDYEAAAEAWRKVTNAEPENGLAWRRLGYCLHVLGKLDEALVAHRRAAEFPAERGRALFNIGCVYSQRGELDQAFEALTEAVAAGFTTRYYFDEDTDLVNARKDARFVGLLMKIDEAEEAASAKRLQVGVVVHEGVELLDFAGPAEVFASAAGPEGSAFHVFTVAPRARTVNTTQGVVVQPGYTIDDCPRIDVLVIPGGATQNLTRDPKFMAWVKERVPQTKVTLTVCTGVFTLAEQGLLDGLSATTHHSAIHGLRGASDKINVRENVRFVDNGRIVTAAGVSAGIDGALHVVERLVSEDSARATARYMEYEWRRTNGVGAPGGAPVAGSPVAAAPPQVDGAQGAPEEAAAEPLYQAALAAAGQGRFEVTLEKLTAALAAGACPTRATVEAAFEPLHGEARFNALIRTYARQSSIRMAPDGEPGEKLVVHGVVREARGLPVANALLYAYHVDARGYYSRGGMDEGSPRLFGYLRTDEDGRYSVTTIRPAHYATSPDNVDQHIHFTVSVAERQPVNFRLSFTDDPIWKTPGRNPPANAVDVRQDAGGTPTAEFNMVLP